MGPFDTLAGAVPDWRADDASLAETLRQHVHGKHFFDRVVCPFLQQTVRLTKPQKEDWRLQLIARLADPPVHVSALLTEILLN